MQAVNRTLIALAFGAALASPAAFAQAKGATGAKATSAVPTSTGAMQSAGQATAGSVRTGERPATPTLPTQADATASDAISARTTKQETQPTTTAAGAAKMDTATKTSAATTNPGKGNWWADADVDGDGKLSTTEAAANAGLNARFATIDSDKDGFVTQDEYRTFFTANASQGEQHAAPNSAVVTRDLWVKLDADADSKISLAEAAGNASLSTAFTAMDSNSDGFVTQAEYTAYAKMHK